MKSEAIKKSQLRTGLPEIKSGYTVRIYQKIKEGDKERLQPFEGLIIALKHGKGINGTFTVRKISDGIGIERIFPLHSPNIEKIEVLKRAKVRRSKLYYMRKRFGKSARLKTVEIPAIQTPAPPPEEEKEEEKPAEIEKKKEEIKKEV